MNKTKIIQSIINDGYQRMAKPRGFTQKKSFSPSKLGYGEGKCPSYWFVAFNGAEFKEETTPNAFAKMAYGTSAHERIQTIFKESGYKVEEEREIENESPPIRGFIDLVVDLDEDDTEVPLEIKTARMESFFHRQASGKPINYHMLQLLIYMRLMGKDKGYLIYENKNDQECVVVPVTMTDRNRQYVDYLFGWMEEVYQAYKDDTFPERPYKEKSKVCQACPVREACWEPREEAVKIKPLELPNP